MRSQFRIIAISAVVALLMAACGGGSSPSPVAPTVTLTSSVTDVSIPSAPPVTLNWSSTNATSCTASGAWSGPLGLSGSQSIVVPQTSTYTISCPGRGGVATASVTINAWVPPNVSLTADRTSVLPNETVLLTWSSQNATECKGFFGLSATLPTSGSQVTAPLTATTRFLLICGNPVFRAGTAEVVVEVAVPKFTAIELPMDSAIDLNDAGDVVGQRRPAGGWSEAVAWSAGANVEVLGCPNPPVCYYSYYPAAMNSTRTVIGRVNNRSGMSYWAFRWYVGVGVDSFINISSPTSITDINDAGQIVGGNPYAPAGAMLISDGVVVYLFGSNGPVSMASAINNASHITGYSVPNADHIRHVFLYADGAVQDLGTLDGFSSFAQDINMVDEIVGSADTAAGTRAFRYADSRFTDLGSLGGTFSRANGINDAGQIVGTSTLAGADPQAQRAFLHANDRMYDLNDLVGPLPLPLSEARKINNAGQIIANACAPPGYASDCHAYLLTPVSPP